MTQFQPTVNETLIVTPKAVNFRTVLKTLQVWHQRRVTRRQLSQLPDYLLRDIGITRADAEQEVNKTFWQN